MAVRLSSSCLLNQQQNSNPSCASMRGVKQVKQSRVIEIMKNFKILLCLFLALITFGGYAQEAKTGKYSLFNPVPKKQMREMATDRPGITETPITVDAGHFQYETAILSYGIQREEGVKTKSYTINALDFHIGLTNSTALQLILDAYQIEHQTERSTGQRTRTDGIGDLTFRLKQNLAGNDQGNFSIALLPYMTLPTAKHSENHKVEAGILLPMELKLPAAWTLGVQFELDRLKDKDKNALHTEILQAISLSHAVIKDLDGIAETYQTYEFKKHQWTNYVNAALQYSVNSNCKFDAGINYGIQHDAQRNFFFGLAYRL
jgi:hypothetical protein